jgi:hypothetical protein
MLGRFCLLEPVLHWSYFLIMQGGNIFLSDFRIFKASTNCGHTDPATDFAGCCGSVTLAAVLTGHELCCVLQQHQAPLD